MAMNVSAFKAEEPWVGHEPYSRMVDINNRAVPEAVQKASQKEKSFKLKMEGAPTSTQSLCVFTDNSIRTAKYTIVSFFPLALMHQFTRNVANQYFLAVYALCPGPPGRLSALGISRRKSALYGVFGWARGALNGPPRRCSGPGRHVGTRQPGHRRDALLGAHLPRDDRGLLDGGGEIFNL